MFQKLKEFFKNLIEIMKRKEMLILPGHLAFYFVLSVVPIITIIFFIATSFNLSLTVITNFIEANFSKEVLNVVYPILDNTGFALGNIVFLCIAFYLASNGFDSIIIASNTIFNLNNSGYIKRRIKAMIMTLLILLLFTFILLVPLFGETILNILTSFTKEDNVLINVSNVLYPVLNIPITFLVVFMFIKLVYTIAPDDAIPTKYVNKGTIFTTLCWMIITVIYSYYIKNFAHFNAYYGGLSSIVILMMWFYFMAYVFVVGLAFNHINVEERIEKTNSMKLDEIQKKVKATKKQQN